MGCFWYLGLLLPVIGLVQVGLQSMADRYTYLPSIGILLLVVWSLPQWLFARLGRVVVALAVADILITLWAFTWIQIGYWYDSYMRVRACCGRHAAGNNYPCQLHLGGILLEQAAIS